MPPPLPSGSPPPPPIPPLRLPVAPVRLGIPGADDLTPDQVRQAIAAGARFVLFPFCVSIVVLTFKRSSPIYFLKPGEGTFARQIPFTLISLLGGWWGIPWGPIWTIASIYTNLAGGKDVTNEILRALNLESPRSVDSPPVVGQMPARKPALSTSQKVLIGSAIAIAIVGVCWMGYFVLNQADSLPGTRGDSELRAAVEHLGSTQPSASGNSVEAQQLARKMSDTMTKIRETYFEKSKRESILDSHDGFRTYCDLQEGQCVFLIHVPELRRFTKEAKESLGKTAWAIGQSLLRASKQRAPGMRLAVGLRGIAAFDRVLIGKFEPEHSNTPAKTGLEEVKEGFGCERELYSWFASPSANTNAPAVAP
jgi:hypothetical protein